VHLSKHHKKWCAVLLFLGFADSFIEFYYHTPYNILWYSNTAFYFLAAAFYLRNSLMFTASFIGYFLGELGWQLDFLSHLLWGEGWFGTTAYMFSGDMSAFRFIFELNHFLIPVVAFIGMLKWGIHPRGWMLVGIIAILFNLGAYALAPAEENVNCVHEFCLYRAINGHTHPLLYLAGWTLSMVLLGLLANAFLMWLKKRYNKKRSRG
jgi:hypothetical protein